MELEKNPFYILSATSRDGRRRLMELTEERSLLFDEEECRDAYSVLTNPRKRLSAEIAWFPGVRPAKIEELLSLAESSPEKILAEESLPSLARANILAEGITRLSAVDASTLSSWLIAIDEAFDYTDAEDVLSLLNSERVVAGFPEISEVSLIEEELENCRNSYRSAIKTALDKLPSRELIRAVTSAVEEATCDGILGINEVLIDTVDLYEVEAQEFLTKEEENIDRLIEMIRTALKNNSSDTQLHSLVGHLKQVVKNWDMVAQPIQLSAKSRGLDHDASKRVGGNVRSLAIDAFNNYNKLEISQQLTALIQEVFAEVDTLAERATEDAETLQELVEERRLAGVRAEEFRREITYEVSIGRVFGKMFKISPEGVEWEGKRWPLESITRLRWGGTKHSVNFIPMGIEYTIVFGSQSALATLTLREKDKYGDIIDKLWRAVGFRILAEFLEGLAQGRKYRFGSAVFDDYGVELERTRLFGTSEREYCSWDEVSIWNANGCFCIGKTTDKKTSEAFSYQEEDNIHILEAAIRMLFNKGGNRLSGIFQK